MTGPTRRDAFRAAAALSLGTQTGGRRVAADPRNGCPLSIGTYSLKGIPLEDAVGLVAGIGYDGIEVAAQPGFDGAPAVMPAERRKAVRRRIEEARVRREPKP